MAQLAGWRMEPTGGTPTSLIRQPPGYVDSKILVPGGAAVTFAVPSGAKVALIGGNGDYYANPTTTATVPGNVADGTASEFKPTAWACENLTNISVISPGGAGASIVTISWYGKN